MRRKVLTIGLFVILIIGIFRIDNPFSKQGEDKDSEKTTLTVWAFSSMNIEAMKKAGEIYAESHPEFTLNVEDVTETDIRTKITVACVAEDLSTLPDIFLMKDIYYKKFVQEFPQVFCSITDTGIDFTKFIEGKTKYSTVNGENYGVPFDNGCAIACYRVDYLKKAGLTLQDMTDKTWTEIIEIGKIVKKKTGYPLFTCVAGTPDIIMTMLESSGTSTFNEDGSVYIKDNKRLKQAVSLYVEAVNAGVIEEVTSYNQYISALNSGTIKGNWIMPSIESAQEQKGLWGITNLPSVDNSAEATHYAQDGGSSWAISSNCKNYDIAVDFLKTTFGNNTNFYTQIMEKNHAVPSYLPAYQEDVFQESLEWWGNDKVYNKIYDYSKKIPVMKNSGIYYPDAKEAIGVAVSNIIQNGADIDKELQGAEDTIKFIMY